jgi:SAM-dependent methyltransferase
MVFMLFHLEDPAAGVRETARVLRAGGRLGVLTWGGEFESEAMRVWSACLDEHGAKPADTNAQARDELVDTPDKLRTLMQSAGLRAERVWCEEMVSQIPIDQLVGIKTGLGREKSRFDGLAEDAQVSCVGEARKRMARLEAGGFVARGPVVYAVAQKEPLDG